MCSPSSRNLGSSFQILGALAHAEGPTNQPSGVEALLEPAAERNEPPSGVFLGLIHFGKTVVAATNALAGSQQGTISEGMKE